MIASQQDILTYLGQPDWTPLLEQLSTMAEQHVKDYLGWMEIEQRTWVEYYPREQSTAMNLDDPHYIVASNHQRALPGFYYAPNIIQLQQLPVRSIVEVREDATAYFGQTAGAFADNTILQAGTDYLLKVEQPSPYGGQPLSLTGHLIRRSFWFPGTLGSVMVTYVAGFTDTELAGRWSVFRTAVLETLADLWLRAMAISKGQRPDIASESLGGGASASYINNRLSGVPIPDAAAEMLTMYVSYASIAM